MMKSPTRDSPLCSAHRVPALHFTRFAAAGNPSGGMMGEWARKEG